jgi:hypothetical protein
MNNFALDLLKLTAVQSLILANSGNTNFVSALTLFSLLPRESAYIPLGATLFSNIFFEGSKGAYRLTSKDLRDIQNLLITYQIDAYFKIPAPFSNFIGPA